MPTPHPPRLTVLTVCTGNMCRSPIMEGLLASRTSASVRVSSAGTNARDGMPMNPYAAAELARVGLYPSRFRSRALVAPLIERADLVLTASREHRSAVCVMVPRAVRRAFTLKEFVQLVEEAPLGLDTSGLIEHAFAQRSTLAGSSSMKMDIDDPVDRSEKVHARVTAEIAEAVDRLVPHLAAL